MRRGIVICAVEKGWQNTRELSLELMRKGYSIDILIKGLVERPVLEMITKYPEITIKSARRFYFRPSLFFKAVIYIILGNLEAVGVEGKKIEKWLYFLSHVFKFKVFLVTHESRFDF